MSHIGAAQSFLSGHQGFVELFAVAGADDIRPRIPEELLHCLRQYPDRGSIGFLNEEVARIAVFKSKEHQVYRLIEIHQKARHFRIGDGNGFSRSDLLDKKRDDRPSGAHHVSVSGAADDGVASLRRHPCIRRHDVLHHGFRNAHRIDRIRRLVGGKADDFFDPFFDGRMQEVVRSLDVCPHRFHREKFATGHLLECRRMEDIIDPGHGIF